MSNIKSFFTTGGTIGGTAGALPVLLSGMLATSAIGSVYIWSVFILPLEKEFGWTRSDISFVFALAMVFFSLGIIFCGWLLSRFPINRVMLLGVFLLPGAYLASSFCSNVYAMYFIYGMIGGTGMGVVYNTILYTCNLWYLKDFGSISGTLQTCLGLSSLALGSLVAALIDMYGWRWALRIVFALSAAALVPAAFFMRQPPAELVKKELEQTDVAESAPDAGDLTWRQMVKTPAFMKFWLMRVFLLSCGIGMIGSAVPLAIELGQSPSRAVFAMGVLSFCNAIGRVALGMVWDKIGPRRTMVLNNSLFLLSFVLLCTATLYGFSFLVLPAFALAGFSYGGVTLIGVSFTRTFFGSKYFAANYGLSTTAMVAASFIGPYIMSRIKTSMGSYDAAFGVFLCFSAGGLLCALFTKKPKETFAAARK